MKKVVIIKNGPYLVSGNIPLGKETAVVGKKGVPERWKKGKSYSKQESYSLCRCGRSKNKPFCDGSHVPVKFDGTENASRKEYLKQASILYGPGVDLLDVPILCSMARFCHLGDGTWSNIANSNNPQSKKLAIQTACNCPSGRLVPWNKNTQKPLEPKFKQSISLIEDPQEKSSGPIWLKGGITLVSSNGKEYEKRNRVTLCRCGKSQNKPFCDGSHLDFGFNDGDESLK